MPDQRLKAWERLFQHALSIIDAAVAAGATQGGWSFGGGTVLMRRHRHRISKDVDIFVPDAQWLGYLTPRCARHSPRWTSSISGEVMTSARVW